VRGVCEALAGCLLGATGPLRACPCRDGTPTPRHATAKKLQFELIERDLLEEGKLWVVGGAAPDGVFALEGGLAGDELVVGGEDHQLVRDLSGLFGGDRMGFVPGVIGWDSGLEAAVDGAAGCFGKKSRSWERIFRWRDPAPLLRASTSAKVIHKPGHEETDTPRS
jgi:hypothetical protein